MRTADAWNQPNTRTRPPYQVGDIVAYQGFAMRIWMVLDLNNGLPPDGAPGLYYALRGNGMPARVYFVVPSAAIDPPLPLVA